MGRLHVALNGARPNLTMAAGQRLQPSAFIGGKTVPSECEIQRVCRETGMDRMQAIYHLRARAELLRRTQPRG